MAERRSWTASRLVIFAKEPTLGAVKSRLAADVGFVEATRWYRANCARLVRRLDGHGRWRLLVALSPCRAASNKSWPGIFPPRVPRIPQGSGSLGARMARVLNLAGPGPVVIVGSDIPSIEPGHVERAFRALGRADMVLGPSSDGGYWLIGKRAGAAPAISLSGVRWSSAETLNDTLAALADRRVELLNTLNDVDRGKDLRTTQTFGRSRA